jgi:hypothetical protein
MSSKCKAGGRLIEDEERIAVGLIRSALDEFQRCDSPTGEDIER